uniref:Transposase n=1 Tax=Heterorhabditis bacteriophora TaxID=37862 RepID=A0A1I7XS44_HETBA
MKKCPQLTLGHKDERLRWARYLMRCGWDKWRDLHKQRRQFSTRNFGGGSAMGLVDLPFVLMKMNSADYQDILGHRLVPHLRFPGDRFTFQQNNVVVRISLSTKTWPKDNDNRWAIVVHRIHADSRQFETVKISNPPLAKRRAK